MMPKFNSNSNDSASTAFRTIGGSSYSCSWGTQFIIWQILAVIFGFFYSLSKSAAVKPGQLSMVRLLWCPNSIQILMTRHLQLSEPCFSALFIFVHVRWKHTCTEILVSSFYGLIYSLPNVGLSTSLDPRVSHAYISLFVTWILIQ